MSLCYTLRPIIQGVTNEGVGGGGGGKNREGQGRGMDLLNVNKNQPSSPSPPPQDHFKKFILQNLFGFKL